MTRAPDPSWTSESAGTVASALWATAPDDDWIALAAEVRHFDGASWTTARVFEPGESFSSVWGSSITDAWVGSTRALTRWNGTSWEDLLPFGVDLVWGVGPGDVWATRAGRIFHWIGGKWVEESLPSGLDASTVRIWSLAGVATDDVWAFGSASVNPAVGLALHWNGVTWSEVDDSTGLAVADRVFESAWASSADDLWMSGVHYPSATELWHWDGVSWAAADASAGGTFGALSGTAANDVWSIGADAGQTGATLRHFDGSAWSTVSIGDRSLSLLAASRADDVWACGSTGQGSVIYHLHHPCNDAAPAPVFTRASAVAVFRTLVALAPTDLWGMDPNGGLADWDGTAWSRVTSPFPASVSPIIASIAGWAPNALWVAGADVMRWDGSGWSDMTPPNPSGYNHKVWGGGANDVWVEQANLFMFHWDGSAWLQTDFQGRNVVVTAMASNSPTDAWALGTDQLGIATIFAHWNGATWTIEPDPGLGRLEFLGAFGLSPTNVWVLAINLDVFDTRMLHYDGSKWTVVATTPGYTGYGEVWASAASDVWATLPQGGLWNYDGSAWSTVDLGADYLYAVTGTPAGEIWASGGYLNQPVIYHHAP